MRKMFGPNYFEKLDKYGVGLGVNPSDARDVYVENYPDLINYIEVTATSSRLRGPDSYTEVRRKKKLKGGAHYWRLEDYPDYIQNIVHSTNVNPVYPETITIEAYQRLDKLVKETNSPWVTEDLGIWLMNERHVYPFFLTLPLTKEALKVTIENVKEFHNNVSAPFNAEFPPVRNIAGDMHAFDFFRILAEETGCGVCLDIGHVLSYQLERGVSPTADFHLLPWDHVTEVHIAGGNIDLDLEGYHYDDNHGDYDIVTVCYDMLDSIIKYAPNLKAITLEIFGAKHSPLTLQKLNDLQNRESVVNWKENKVKDTLNLPEYNKSREKVKNSVVAMHDLLHGSEEVSGSALERSGKDFLDMFANSEQRKWEYERKSRIQLHGLNLESYYPLINEWLVQKSYYSEKMKIYEHILENIPGHSVPVWDKVKNLYQDVISEKVPKDDIVYFELLNFETWMNDCVTQQNDSDVKSFSFNILEVVSSLNKGETINKVNTDSNSISLNHIGNGEIGLVTKSVDFDSDENNKESVPPRGSSFCCSGE